MESKYDCLVTLGWESGPWPQPTPGAIEIETCGLMPQAIVSVTVFLPEDSGLTDDRYEVVVRIDPPPGSRGEWRFEVWSCIEDQGWASKAINWGIGELTDPKGDDPTEVLGGLSDALWSMDTDGIFEALTRLRGGSIEIFALDD